jgi:hypothetical protein
MGHLTRRRRSFVTGFVLEVYQRPRDPERPVVCFDGRTGWQGQMRTFPLATQTLNRTFSITQSRHRLDRPVRSVGHSGNPADAQARFESCEVLPGSERKLMPGIGNPERRIDLAEARAMAVWS